MGISLLVPSFPALLIGNRRAPHHQNSRHVPKEIFLVINKIESNTITIDAATPRIHFSIQLWSSSTLQLGRQIRLYHVIVREDDTNTAFFSQGFRGLHLLITRGASWFHVNGNASFNYDTLSRTHAHDCSLMTTTPGNKRLLRLLPLWRWTRRDDRIMYQSFDNASWGN